MDPMTADTRRKLTPTTRWDRDGRRLLLAVASLLGIDVVGGLLSIASGVNTAADAWGSRATLAAPIPMMAGQALLAIASARWPDRRGAVAAGLLAVACGISGISGFFDGQLGKEGLSAPLVGFQWLLVVATLGVGGLAAARSIRLARRR
jgi:hypothetical protein